MSNYLYLFITFSNFFFHLENENFANFFNDKIKSLTSILYTLQHKKHQKPITDPEEFVNYIESEDVKLKGFFDVLYQSINPASKNEATKKKIKTKVMFICYQLAAIHNKQVSSIKSSIGLFMSGCGTSEIGIDSLAGMGLSSTYQTVFNRMNNIIKNHNSSVENYIKQNVYKKLIIYKYILFIKF